MRYLILIFVLITFIGCNTKKRLKVVESVEITKTSDLVERLKVDTSKREESLTTNKSFELKDQKALKIYTNPSSTLEVLPDGTILATKIDSLIQYSKRKSLEVESLTSKALEGIGKSSTVKSQRDSIRIDQTYDEDRSQSPDRFNTLIKYIGLSILALVIIWACAKWLFRVI